jgi:cytochrome c biogenesis protein CcmG/thiol:disulfide interchange protein DsbE
LRRADFGLAAAAHAHCGGDVKINVKFNWPLLAAGTLVIGAFVFVIVHGFGRDPHEVPFMLTGKPAPDFTLTRVDDGRALTARELHGKPLILNFWSTWCVPCASEAPALEWGATQLAGKVEVIGVVYEDTETNVREFLHRKPSGYVQTLDAKGTAAVDFGLAGVPETYFIDAQGQIVYKHVGPIDQETLMEKARLIEGHS